ncbi:hypothetical protein GCM10009119_06440 [Algoriphagus jejuensis]|uniref:HTH araC/xylS-type domain-containing protein n=1 Tax=Algoriphagus jejuensis TaxID=419934 RepID=A0ABN1MWR0_9BACT
MNLDLSLVNILILFGAVQGLTFAVVLFASKRHPGAVYLGLAVLALVYNGLETFNWSSNLEKHTAFFDYYPFVLIFLVGPSFYLYQLSLLSENPLSRRQKLWIYSTFIFQFCYLTICWFTYFLVGIGLTGLRPGLTLAGQFYAQYSEPLSVLVYLFFTGLSLREFYKLPPRSEIEKRNREKGKMVRAWVKQILVFQIILALVWTATLVVSYSGVWPFTWSEYYPVEILLVLFLYWIAIAGYLKIRSITIEPKRKRNLADREVFEGNEKSPQMILLQNAMESDQLYRNPELSLASLSEKIEVPVKQISKTLNQEAGMNFNDFVNSYRVEAFCGELKKPENNNLTLLGIASTCGFNSSATFQRAFKKFKGVTPGVYFQRREEMGESGR